MEQWVDRWQEGCFQNEKDWKANPELECPNVDCWVSWEDRRRSIESDIEGKRSQGEVMGDCEWEMHWTCCLQLLSRD